MSAPRLARAFRLTVVVGLIAFAIWRSGLAEIGQTLARAHPGPLLGAVALVVLDRGLMAYRWMLLLCTVPRDVRPSLSEVLRIFFVSTFVGTFLPASVGGDAVRAYSLAAHDVEIGDAVASVFLDRLLGVMGILLLAAPALWAMPDLRQEPVVIASVALLLVICSGALAVAFSRRAAALVERAVVVIPIARARHAAGAFVRAVHRYEAHRGVLAGVLAASVAVQVLRVLQAYALGQSLSIQNASLMAYLAYVPLIVLIMLLPITINGLGTSQVAFIWFFGHAGVPPSEAFVLSLLFLGLGVVGNLPGGALYASGGLNGRRTPQIRTPPAILK